MEVVSINDKIIVFTSYDVFQKVKTDKNCQHSLVSLGVF
jgi:hypothetical protein